MGDQCVLLENLDSTLQRLLEEPGRPGCEESFRTATAQYLYALKQVPGGELLLIERGDYVRKHTEPGSEYAKVWARWYAHAQSTIEKAKNEWEKRNTKGKLSGGREQIWPGRFPPSLSLPNPQRFLVKALEGLRAAATKELEPEPVGPEPDEIQCGLSAEAQEALEALRSAAHDVLSRADPDADGCYRLWEIHRTGPGFPKWTWSVCGELVKEIKGAAKSLASTLNALNAEQGLPRKPEKKGRSLAMSPLVISHRRLLDALAIVEQERRNDGKFSEQTQFVVRDSLRVFRDAVCEDAGAAAELIRRADFFSTATSPQNAYANSKSRAAKLLAEISEIHSCWGLARRLLKSQPTCVPALEGERTLVRELLIDQDVPAPLCSPLSEWLNESLTISSEGERMAAYGCYLIAYSPVLGFVQTTEIMEAADAMVEWCTKHAAEHTLGQAAKTEPRSGDPRDKWIYEEAMKGVKWSSIMRGLMKRDKTWEPIMSENGVKAAAKRYAERNNLSEPPPRKAGRRGTR